MFRIEADHGRFRDIVRGKIRKDLRRYLSTSELLTRKGATAVSVPIPQVELPRFRFGENKRRGVGQGEGESGEPVEGVGAGEGEGAAGEHEGEHPLEVEVDLEELAEMLGRELELPFIEPKGRHDIITEGGRFTGVRSQGPNALRHLRRTYRETLKRAVASGTWDPADPRIVPEKADFRYRARKAAPVPESSAVALHMMDISGSMGREQKDIVRIKAFWIDTWLRSQYENLDVVYIVHDAVARVVDQQAFFHLRESGGTKISSAYDLCLKLITERYRPEDWNIYPFHYSDGDNWSARDTERCVSLVRDEIVPRVNQFSYGQVKSAYGSGQFKKDLDDHLGSVEKVVTASVADREGIPDAIRVFLGKGR